MRIWHLSILILICILGLSVMDAWLLLRLDVRVRSSVLLPSSLVRPLPAGPFPWQSATCCTFAPQSEDDNCLAVVCSNLAR